MPTITGLVGVVVEDALGLGVPGLAIAALAGVAVVGGSRARPLAKGAIKGYFSLKDQTGTLRDRASEWVAGTREELEDLKDRYLDRLHVIHVFSREQQDVALLNGRISAALLRELDGKLLDIASYDEVFICGPEPMTLEARDVLIELRADPLHVHLELFGSVTATAPRVHHETGERRQLTFIYNGVKTDVEGHPDDRSLVFALEELSFFSKEFDILGVYPAHAYRDTFKEQKD